MNPSGLDLRSTSNSVSKNASHREGRASILSKDKDKETEKTADLVWVNYETKLRKLMQDLLQPTVKRSLEDRELFDNLMKRCEQLTKRIEDLETITHKSERKETIFDELFHKIRDLDTERKSELLEVNERFKKLEDQMNTIGLDYNHLRENLKNEQDFSQKLSEDFSKNVVQLDEYKKSFANMVSNLQKSMAQSAEGQKNTQISNEEKFQTFTNNLTDLKNTVYNNEISLEATKKSLNDTITKLNSFEKDCLENNASIENFSKHIESIKFLKIKTEEIELRTRTTDNYLEKYLGLFMQAQISETLHHCLLQNNKRKLYVYEEKKFKELNTEILRDDGNPDLQKRINSIHILLESTIRRYSKSMAAYSLGIRSREPESSKTENSSERVQTRKGTTVTITNAKVSEKSFQPVEEDRSDAGSGGYSPKKKIEMQESMDYLMTTHPDDRGKHEETDVQFSTREISKSFEAGEGQSVETGEDKSQINMSKSKKILQTVLQTQDEGSDLSDLDAIQSRQIMQLQSQVAILRETHESDVKRINEEMNERISKLAREQLEISENASYSVRNAVLELDQYLKHKQKEEMDKVIEMESLYQNLKGNTKSQEKLYQFAKRISETLVPVVETLNNLLVLCLREEKEKKNLVNILQQHILPLSPFLPLNKQAAEEPLKKRKEPENAKKMLDLPYLSGTRVGTLPDDKTETIDFEIRLKYNDKLVKKVEFLELTFDSFKDCMSFSNKFRTSSNFTQFYEGESGKSTAHQQKTLKPARGAAQHLLYEDRSQDRIAPTGLKQPVSRLASVGYKNYMADSQSGRPFEKKRTNSGVVRDKESNLNKSFY